MLLPQAREFSKGLIYVAPAMEAVRHHTKVVDGLATDSVFAGVPTPELDAAWHDLLASMRRARECLGPFS